MSDDKEIEEIKERLEQVEENQYDLRHRLKTFAGYISKLNPSAGVKELVERFRRAVSHLHDIEDEKGEDER